MLYHDKLTRQELLKFFKTKSITLAGNRKLKIYGTLRCKSGKRMKRVNRVFFASKEEATRAGFKPCAHCLPSEYQKWKVKIISSLVE